MYLPGDLDYYWLDPATWHSRETSPISSVRDKENRSSCYGNWLKPVHMQKLDYSRHCNHNKFFFYHIDSVFFLALRRAGIHCKTNLQPCPTGGIASQSIRVAIKARRKKDSWELARGRV